MDENLLIPRSSNIASIDVATIIGDVFQDNNEPTFKKNVAQNVDKFVVENRNLKASSAKVIGVFNDVKLAMEDISLVENSLMVRQGASMNEKYYLDQDKIVSEHLKLKRKELISDLCEPEVKKYGLLQKIDFLPIKPEKSMDFRINSNQHLCVKCPSNTDNQLAQSRKGKVSLIPIRLPSIPLKKIPVDEIFRAEPNEILFSNFEVDTTYKKTFKLRNVSRRHQSFLPSFLPKDSVFKVSLHPNSNSRLAPGMCAIFTVVFKIDIFENRNETITFRSQSASETTVKLMCFRKPPNLKIYVYKDLCRFVEKIEALSINNFKIQRNIALNSTIDCGSCFIGDIHVITLVLRNDGSTGEFFFVPEEDWYYDTLQSISTDMTVELPQFSIFPSFFRVQEDHFIEVIINFFPLSFGLEVEKLFLLCNNNALQDIEIIGDGVLFDQNTVIIETDFSLNCKQENYNETSGEVEEFIKKPPSPRIVAFGDCMAHISKTQYVTVHNNSTVDLYYKWVVKYPKRIKNEPKIKLMDSKMISIGIVANYLPANRTTKFPITLLAKHNKLGHFGLILDFYILDVPEIALANDVDFWATEESRSSSSLGVENSLKRLNLVIAELELSCNMIELKVNLHPPKLIFSTLPLSNHIYGKTIEITSNTDVPLECAWIPPHKFCISVKPVRFTLQPNCSSYCNLSIYFKKAKTFRETLKLMINNDSLRKSFRVKVRVYKAMGAFSKRIINFGHLYKIQRPISSNLIIENGGSEKLDWKIFELHYNPIKGKICKFKSSQKRLSVCQGSLARYAKFSITYTPKTKLKYRSWVSWLILISTVPKSIALDVCMVVYHLSEPRLTINTNLSNFPVLQPKKFLYLNVPELFEMTLSNTHNYFPGTFFWGAPIGNQAMKLDICFKPKFGNVPCSKSIPISLTITPLDTGVVDNFVLPCFIGYATRPLLLPVQCFVDNIHLRIYLPVSNRVLRVDWPPPIITTYSDISLVGEVENEMEEYRNLPENENMISDMDPGCSSLLCPSLQSIVNYTAEGMRGCEEEYFGPIVDEFNSLVTFEESKSLILPQLPLTSLKTAFGTEVFLHDYVIEFRQVPLKKPIKKSMLIKNLTPVIGKFLIECTNFYRNDEYDDEMNSSNIMYKLNIRKKDEWEESIGGDLGLVVKIKPFKGVLQASRQLPIDIWVYANTWGTYMEEVKIDINDLQPFCFNILVEAVGTPIEFPMACNSIRSSPVLRFGNIPYLSDPVTRRLIIKNTSSIPINLGWHVFLCKPKSPTDRRSRKKPFNVVLDTFELPINPESLETDFKLMVTPVNYGKENDEIFQVLPRDLRLNAKSSAVLNVMVNPQLFHPQFDKTYIEARLIGHLHLGDEHCFQSNLFKRLTGTDIPPAKIKLLATIEMPLLKIELVKGETRIRAYANDIIEAQEVIFERILVFKNYDTAPIMVYMHTSNPFKVIYLHTKANPKKNLKAAEVLPQECVEVLVRCTIDGEAVLQYSNMLFNEKESIFTEVPNFDQHSITLVRSLNIHQYGLQKQITNLELILFYPKLIVSHEFIDFGVAFVGGTKKSLLTLTNPTESHVPFNIQSNAGHFLTIVPNNGIVPKAIGNTPTSIILSLYFMPKECQVFQETLRVCTNMPFYNFQVNIMGTGSNNEKFLNEGV